MVFATGKPPSIDRVLLEENYIKPGRLNLISRRGNLNTV